MTNASRGTVNARRFQSQWAAVVTAVVFEFSVMRCQPLRRALAINLYFGIVGIKIKT
ncbi:acetyltransferase [Vibrio cholerae]|nr:acetyltransferase [Vibrio cholerae]MCD1200564.1 acetyltransferase [Vibrio cholerae]MCD1209460.1 acetyltransferase [Vibrio cholerae]MCD1213155.1 acetyltransferase [Vibrio cholerae]MCD1216921.1 acetyltransferase [Vibrio cholerae]